MGGPLAQTNPMYTPNLDINPASKAPANFVAPNYQSANNNATSSIALFKIPSSATNSLYVDGKIFFICKKPKTHRLLLF